MSRPTRTLLWMAVFLVVVGTVSVVVFQPLQAAFLANAPFNGLILGALAAGILINFRQVAILGREIDWIDRFRRTGGEPDVDPPRLLAPMARMLARQERGRLSLSPAALRSLLDGIRARLDESRDLSRYMVGLLVFLGLLGTFWGLLDTVRSVSGVVGELDVSGSRDVASVVENLQKGLQGPLSGMGTAFSSSLFGLAGSLVLGFLDLQAGHAQNRFFNELEEWLSGATRISGTSLAEGDVGVPAYVEALLEKTADSVEQLGRAVAETDHERRASNERIRELTGSLSRLSEQLGAESRELAGLAETHAELRRFLGRLAEEGPARDRLDEDLRSELRLLNRTVAAALERNRSSGA